MKIQRKPDAMNAVQMTPDELRRRLKKARVTSRQAAALLDCHQSTVDRMLAGTRPINFLFAYAARHLA